MTPQEKAKDLVVTYKNILPTMNYQVLDETAKKCALIAVEEMLELAKKADKGLNAVWKSIYPEEKWSQEKYWQQVEKEIQKL